MEAICELPEITALQRYHGNSCNWAGSWGGFTEQTFGTVLFCPDISNLLDIGKRSILKKEAVPLYTETNDLRSRKSMDVEMREPWAMKQAHKNVAYKWNRTWTISGLGNQWMCYESWFENKKKEELISQQISEGKVSQTKSLLVKCYLTSVSFFMSH